MIELSDSDSDSDNESPMEVTPKKSPSAITILNDDSPEFSLSNQEKNTFDKKSLVNNSIVRNMNISLQRVSTKSVNMSFLKPRDRIRYNLMTAKHNHAKLNHAKQSGLESTLEFELINEVDHHLRCIKSLLAYRKSIYEANMKIDLDYKNKQKSVLYRLHANDDEEEYESEDDDIDHAILNTITSNNDKTSDIKDHTSSKIDDETAAKIRAEFANENWSEDEDDQVEEEEENEALNEELAAIEDMDDVEQLLYQLLGGNIKYEL